VNAAKPVASEGGGEMADQIKWSLTVGFAVLLAAAVPAAQSAQHETQLPAAVKQAVQQNKPGAEIDKLEVETESGITLYDIEFKAAQGEIEVAEDGTVMDVTIIVDEKEVPAPAVAAIKTAAAGQAVKQFEKSEVRAEIVKDGGKGRISKLSTPKYVYEAELTKGEVEVTPDGKVIKAGK
jgi:hypothetical protein